MLVKICYISDTVTQMVTSSKNFLYIFNSTYQIKSYNNSFSIVIDYELDTELRQGKFFPSP